LELEGTPDQGHHQSLDIRAAVGEDEVLAARFTHQAWIGAVGVDVGAHRFPHVLERRGAAGEVDARQIRMLQDQIAYGAAGSGDGARLPAREVKLKGVTAKIKPSSPRCSTRVQLRGVERGCWR